MPLFWFHIDTSAPPQSVIARMRSIVGQDTGTPGYAESVTRMWKQDAPSEPPFTGTVSTNSFKIRLATSYRDSFLPVIRGRVVPADVGSRLQVIMYVHPMVALSLAVVFWLGLRGHGTFRKSSAFGMPVGAVFLLIVTLMLAVGFFPQALHAKRLISDTVLYMQTN